MFAKILLFGLFGILFTTTFANEDSGAVLYRHSRNLQKRSSNPSLPKDKYDAILKIYSAPGEIADKDKKADDVSQSYSSTEKQIVERIKNFFHKRADILKKFPQSTTDILKTIRELRKKQKDTFNTIPKDQQKDASFIIFGVAPHDLTSSDHPEQRVPKINNSTMCTWVNKVGSELEKRSARLILLFVLDGEQLSLDNGLEMNEKRMSTTIVHIAGGGHQPINTKMASIVKCLAVLAVVATGVSSQPFRHDPFNPLGPWHKRTLHCGLPRFIHKLPEEYQQKIKAIWADYQDGEECFKELKQTKEIVHSLPTEARHKIFKGMCGPSFLKNASQTVRAEFKKVWFDPNLNIDEKELAFKRLAYSLLSGEALQQFVKWEADLQERKHERNEKIAKLSPAAKAAYDKWMSMRKEEIVFLNSLSTEIRQELRLICGFCGGHKHGSGPGDKEHGSGETTTAAPEGEETKTETEKFFRFHDDALDEFFRRTEEELMDENECSAYFY